MTLALNRCVAILAVLSLAVVSGCASTSGTPVPVVQAPVGDSHVLTSAIMRQDREINVLLPPGYEASPERTWPVVYLLDGGQAQDFPHYAGLVRQAIADGEIEPVIFVGIASQDRQNELTWRSTDREILRRWPNHGQSDRFRQAIEREIKPWVEARYRTNGDDTVLGESAAGLFIVETFLNTPNLFDRYLAVSPSMWWDQGSLGDAAPELVADIPPGPRQLLLTIGDEGGEMQTGLDALVDALEAGAPQGLSWAYQPRHDLTHSTIFAATALDFLRQSHPPSERTE